MSTKKPSGKWIHGPITVKAQKLNISPSELGYSDESGTGQVFLYNGKFFVQQNNTAWEACDLPNDLLERLNSIAKEQSK